MAKINLFFFIFFFIASLLIFSAAASYQAQAAADNHKFRIFLGSYDNARIYGGFAFELKGKWKTYWKNAGDAGLPLKVRAASHDISIHWPAPSRFFYQDGIYSYVYGDQVIIPFSFPNPHPQQDVKLRVAGEYAVCDVVCIPYTFDEQLALPFGARRAAADDDVQRALRQAPIKPAAQDDFGLNIKADRNIVHISFRAASFGKVRDVLVDAGDVSLRAPKLIFDGDEVSALLAYKNFTDASAGAPPQEIIKKIKTILVQTDRGTFQIFGQIFDQVFGAPSPLSSFLFDEALWPFLIILASAFLGGLILNIMPCVLPVISLKLVQMTQPTHRLSMRAQLGWTIFGILLSFILLALLVYGLQQAGEIVGWGFHFQQPVFVLFMMSVLLLFAFAQMDFLQLDFMSKVQSGANFWLDRFQPERPAFHIFYGGAIALLASPCTAPFLGSAVGFALAQSLAVIVAVFFAIACGLAMPWMILWLWPQGRNFLPSSVRWTVFVKNFAAFLLYGSALWLLWVAAGQIGVWAAFGFFVAFHVALLLLAGTRSPLRRYAALGIIFAAIAVPAFVPLTSPERTLRQDGLVWHFFSERDLEAQRRSGKIIFMDISADWCLTCKYNKVNVLLDEEVRAALGGGDIYLMAGDLTNVNEDITRFIRKQGRGGIPFNAIYRRGGREILSEILSKRALLEGLASARAQVRAKN